MRGENIIDILKGQRANGPTNTTVGSNEDHPSQIAIAIPDKTVQTNKKEYINERLMYLFGTRNRLAVFLPACRRLYSDPFYTVQDRLANRHSNL